MIDLPAIKARLAADCETAVLEQEPVPLRKRIEALEGALRGTAPRVIDGAPCWCEDWWLLTYDDRHQPICEQNRAALQSRAQEEP